MDADQGGDLSEARIFERTGMEMDGSHDDN
jgi:hypothetical protein